MLIQWWSSTHMFKGLDRWDSYGFSRYSYEVRGRTRLKMKDDASMYKAPVLPEAFLNNLPPAAVLALAPYLVLDGADVVELSLPSGIIRPVSGTPPVAQPPDSVLTASLSLILVVGAVYGSVFVLLF